MFLIHGFQHLMRVCHKCQWNYKTGSFSIGISRNISFRTAVLVLWTYLH